MLGLGTDIIEIERVRRAMTKQRFVQRVFTEAEQAWMQSLGENAAQSAAGLFCAKEAVAKALGRGFGRGLSFRDVEIGHTELGAPVVLRPAGQFAVSISHCQEYAVATVVCMDLSEKEE